MTSEQVTELQKKAKLVTITYKNIDWGGSQHSFEKTHGAFRTAMHDLDQQLLILESADDSRTS